MNYYQLQATSCYQFGQSSIKVDEYFSNLKRVGYAGGAFNDLNSLLCFPYLDENSLKYGLKGFFSSTINLKINDLVLKVCLFVLNEKGYINLVKLINENLEFYDLDLLKKHSVGLGLVIKTEDECFKDSKFLKDNELIFYKLNSIFDVFFFGIEIYSSLEQERIHFLREFIKEHNYIPIAFNKVNYLDNKNQFKSYLILKAIFEKTTLSLNDLEVKSGPYYVLSSKVLKSIYTIEEIENQELLVSKIDFKFNSKRDGLLEFSSTPDIDLKKLVFNGLKRINKDKDENYIQRVNYELDIISKMNFSNYFLIVSDYVNHFRNLGMNIGPGRGSACSSLVSYCLDITKIDPLKYNLYFERFLNPLRKGMPDIDIDFPDDERNKVIEYLIEKYGTNRVSQILTFSNLKTKAAIRRIGMVFNDIKQSCINTLSLTVSSEYNLENKLKRLLKDPYYKMIFNLTNLILDYPLTTSIHASGVILSNNSLFDEVYVKKDKINVSLYEYPFLEEQGFLKLDILGLANLSFIRKIKEEIIKNKKELVDPYTHLDDIKAYKLLNEKMVLDIFQLESIGIKRVILQIKPNNINDITAILALYRPGPMKNISTYANRKNNHVNYTLLDPRLKPILQDTYGILIYQEQILEIAKKIACFDGSKADLFRKVVSKKDSQKMHELKKDFIDGCVKNSLSLENSEKLYQSIEEFANYGFNKAHAVAYSYITYSLLFYKSNYPIEFYLTSLNNLSLSSSKFEDFCFEINKFKFKISTVNILYSSYKAVFINNTFYLGFESVSVLSEKFMDILIKEREIKQFDSFEDFAFRCDLSQFSDRELIALINSGALDCFNLSRKSLLDELDNIKMAFKFATSFSTLLLPTIKSSKQEKKTVIDFINEYLTLGVVLSMKLTDFIKNKVNINKLFVVLNVSIYNDGVKLTLINNFRTENIYISKNVNNISKNDILYIENYEQNYKKASYEYKIIKEEVNV